MKTFADPLPVYDWGEASPDPVARPKGAAADLPDAVWRLLEARFPGVAADGEALDRFLNPKLANLGRPFDMPGVREAAGKIREAVRSGGEVVVFGDFDADGVTATAILTDVIRACGGRARPFIPRRSEGYGLSEAAVGRCLAGGVPALLVTVDCGLGAGPALRRFLDAGASVVVADHHLPGDPLPEACAVVAPHLPGVPGPCRHLCGAGVAFKIACGAVALKHPECDAAGRAARARLFSWLDALSIATVADVVPLVGENRLLVSLGLARLDRAPRPGLRELINQVFSDYPAGGFCAHHLGFVLGPHINAAGRVASADAPLELLLAADADTARLRAIDLKHANAVRRSEDARLRKEAEAQIAAGGAFDPARDGAVVVAAEGWPAGVVGLAASDLSGRYRRPAAVVSLSGDGEGRGSARAPSGYDAYAALAACAPLLSRFGGHEGAAGFSLPAENLPAFRRAFADACLRQVGAVCVRTGLDVAGWLGAGDVDLSLLAALRRLEPFGEGNPEPVWGIRDVSVQASAFGKDAKAGLRLLLRREGGFELEGVWFGAAERLSELGARPRWDVAGTLLEDFFAGGRRVRLRVVDARPAL